MTDLPALPDGWAWSTVGDVGRIQLGRQRSPQWHDGPNMRPYLRVKNVFEDRIDVSDVKEMEFPPDQFATYGLEPGDILLCEGQSPELVGRPAMYRGELPGACFTNSLIRFQPHSGIDPHYALYAFLHLMYSGRFRREARITTNIAHLSATRLSSVEFPVAPAAEQQRIVAAIEEHLSRCEAARGWFDSGRRRVLLLERSILSIAQSEGQENRLGELLLSIEAGKSFMTAGRPAQPGEWGVVKVSAMTWGRFRDQENKAVPREHVIDRRYEIRSGELLMSRANTSEYVGATVLVGRCRPYLLLSDKSMRLSPAAGVDARWLQYALRSPHLRNQMSLVATGTSDSMRNISQAKVKALRILLPSMDRQVEQADRIEAAMSSVELLTREAEAIGRRTGSLRRAIFAAAFAGQLVEQDPTDEPASVLLDRIRAEDPANQQKKVRS